MIAPTDYGDKDLFVTSPLSLVPFIVEISPSRWKRKARFAENKIMTNQMKDLYHKYV